MKRTARELLIKEAIESDFKDFDDSLISINCSFVESASSSKEPNSSFDKKTENKIISALKKNIKGQLINIVKRTGIFDFNLTAVVFEATNNGAFNIICFLNSKNNEICGTLIFNGDQKNEESYFAKKSGIMRFQNFNDFKFSLLNSKFYLLMNFPLEKEEYMNNFKELSKFRKDMKSFLKIIKKRKNKTIKDKISDYKISFLIGENIYYSLRPELSSEFKSNKAEKYTVFESIKDHSIKKIIKNLSENGIINEACANPDVLEGSIQQILDLSYLYDY